MDSKILKNLEQAKAYAYSMRMVEAYNILRRYFDRLPFDPEPEHAEYIGLFLRVLCELGKEHELKFYLAELERLDGKMDSPPVKYQLGVVYMYLKEPRWEASREMFESILKEPGAKIYHVKAKIMLAHYFDFIKNDTPACRRLIDSIEPTGDPYLEILVEIWRAKILRDEKKYPEAEKYLLDIISRVTPQSDWHGYFSAKIVLIHLYLSQQTPKLAEPHLLEMRTLFEGRHFKGVMQKIELLEKNLSKGRELGTIRFQPGLNKSKVYYENKTISLTARSPSDKLLATFAKRGYLNKAMIVKTIYARGYDSSRDDKLVYYHIHSLRKRLGGIGLPIDAIRNEDDGYRLIPKVELLEEDL